MDIGESFDEIASSVIIADEDRHHHHHYSHMEAEEATEMTEGTLEINDEEVWPLHRACFDGDHQRLVTLLDLSDPIERDIHGNTPLHIAVMLGHRECIREILDRNVTIKIKNNLGWSPLAEAISYGDRPTIELLLRGFKRQTHELVQSRRDHLITALKGMGDFRLVLKWDFQSWVPFLSRILPSDECVITKKGSSLRLDTTLVDFSEMRWVRGDISFLFIGDCPVPAENLTVMDNETCVYQRIVHSRHTDAEIDREVDLLMSNDIVSGDLSTKSIEFTRAQSGWIWKEDRSEQVGPFSAQFYNVSGISLRSRRRREHLSAQDIDRNKAILDTLAGGDTSLLENSHSNNTTNAKSASNQALNTANGVSNSSESKNEHRHHHHSDHGDQLAVPSLATSSSAPSLPSEVAISQEASSAVASNSHAATENGVPLAASRSPKSPRERSAIEKLILPDEHRQSLPPPRRRITSWEEYLQSSDGQLGREIITKDSRHTFKLTLAMSEEFPLTVEALLDVLEVIAPLKHFSKLREFVEMKLPPGFPVKIELPVLPAITARVTFNDFQFSDDIRDDLFEIPVGYVEDPTRFPDL